MTNLKVILKNRLHKAERIAVLGVGSDLRGDDAAGVLLAQHLQQITRKPSRRHNKIRIFIGASAPENLTGEIKAFEPDYILIVDSADMGKKPGAVDFIDPGKIGGVSFCTHTLPPKVMIDYLVNALGCEVGIIGIQPKNIGFGSSLSKEIGAAVKKISNTILEIIVKEKN